MLMLLQGIINGTVFAIMVIMALVVCAHACPVLMYGVWFYSQFSCKSAALLTQLVTPSFLFPPHADDFHNYARCQVCCRYMHA